VEISSRKTSKKKGKRLYSSSSNVIQPFHSSTTLSASPTTTKLIAQGPVTRGGGKPSAVTARENSQSGSRLAKAACQEPKSAQPILRIACMATSFHYYTAKFSRFQ
jgi:hypothetical protein